MAEPDANQVADVHMVDAPGETILQSPQASHVDDHDLEDDLQDDEPQPDESTSAEDDEAARQIRIEMLEGTVLDETIALSQIVANGTLPETQLDLPSDQRTLVKIAPYFGYLDAGQAKKFFMQVLAPGHMDLPDRLRAVYKETYGVEMHRPGWPTIEKQMVSMLALGPLDVDMASFAEKPVNKAVVNWVYIIEYLKRRWFLNPGAPFAGTSIPARLFNERTNLIVKILDRRADGAKPSNQKRTKARQLAKSKTLGAASRPFHAKVQTPRLERGPALSDPATRAQPIKNKLKFKASAARLMAAQRELEGRSNYASFLQKLRDQIESMEGTIEEQKEEVTTMEAGDEGFDELEKAIEVNTTRLDTLYRQLHGIKEGTIKMYSSAPDTNNMGLSTAAPKTVKYAQPTIPTESSDENKNNPKHFWFNKGMPIGIEQNHMIELDNFKATKWEYQDTDPLDLPEPNYAVGNGDNVVCRPRSQDASIAGLEKRVAALKTSASKETTATVAEQSSASKETTAPDAEQSSASKETAAPVAEQSSNIQAGEEEIVIPPEEEAVVGPVEAYSLAAQHFIEKAVEALHTRKERRRKAFVASDWEKVKSDGLCDSDELALRPVFGDVLKDKRYDGAALTNANDAEVTDETDDVAPMDESDEKFRLQADETANIMESHAKHPADLRKAENILHVDNRLHNKLPGQGPDSFTNLWWQMTGAAELVTRRRRAEKTKEENFRNACKNNHPSPDDVAFSEVDTGVILADEVGIGKTITWCISKLAVRISPGTLSAPGHRFPPAERPSPAFPYR
jgi:hypothetical protein